MEVCGVRGYKLIVFVSAQRCYTLHGTALNPSTTYKQLLSPANAIDAGALYSAAGFGVPALGDDRGCGPARFLGDNSLLSELVCFL